MVNYKQYHAAGYKVFGLFGINEQGGCACGDPECKALYKHPRLNHWQSIPLWSDEQLESMESLDHFVTGFGVLCDDLLVVDVDVRNGGLEGLEVLNQDLGYDLVDECFFIVKTGSNDGSMHLYFKSPDPPLSLSTTVKKYKGIDFKSSGYVVGEGSYHKSGNYYESIQGSILDVGEAPQDLIDLIKIVKSNRTRYEGELLDVSDDDLENIVNHISNNDCDYEKWITVGMAIHEVTGGSNAGYSLWQYWSMKSSKHDDKGMEKKWDSFGKHSNKATLGSLIYHAREDGDYRFPLKFDPSFMDVKAPSKDLLDVAHIDLKRPPDFVGKLTEWINSQCRYPRENLAVGAALLVMSATAGVRHYIGEFGLTGNMIILGTAGSGSGKEAILQSISDLLSSAGVSRAINGKFKSDKEFIENLIDNQVSTYVMDEVGEELTRIENAKKRGGATYLEGLFGSLMAVYSKARGNYFVTGDHKRQMRSMIDDKMKQVNQKADKGEISDSEAERLLSRLKEKRREADHGIVEPYLTMFGVSSPVAFDHIVTHETATNGLIARASLFHEHETNPRWKDDFKQAPADPKINNTLRNLFWGGNYDVNAQYEEINRKTNWVDVPLSDDARTALQQVMEYFYDMAEESKNENGLEAIPRRGWELCAKVSLLLGCAGKLITLEHVQFGFAVAARDVKYKMELAYANDKQGDKEEGGSALATRISTLLGEDPITIGVIYNRVRNATRDEIDATVEFLRQKGLIHVEEREFRKGRTTLYISLAE